MGLHIVLYQPEIPANTGNIARTCVATNTSLHLIRPLGFSTDDRMLKRAGLDFWPHVDLHYYDSLEELFTVHPGGAYYFLTKFGEHAHTEPDFRDMNQAYFFVFGRESSGLPDDIKKANREHCLRIPMSSTMRSLNLANSAAVFLYEVLRQQSFPDLR